MGASYGAKEAHGNPYEQHGFNNVRRVRTHLELQTQRAENQFPSQQHNLASTPFRSTITCSCFGDKREKGEKMVREKIIEGGETIYCSYTYQCLVFIITSHLLCLKPSTAGRSNLTFKIKTHRSHFQITNRQLSITASSHNCLGCLALTA